MTDPSFYKNLQDTERVELVVYGSSPWWWSCCAFCTESDDFIDDGRPHELSAISLADWSLLSSSIKDYRNGVLTYTRKFFYPPLLLFYIIILIPVFMPEQYWVWVAQQCAIALMVIFICVIRCLVANYLRDKFHPAVYGVVEELRPAISASGFEMEYIVLDGWWQPRSILCFTRNEAVP
jgi:hypothetical protein